ncbi:hypothetical protein BWP33_07630 [Simonsiella muelleri ATCC 29453]|nr:hypothetical protein BWP33_07630 [Simonsiella muelleri ATCC 29453]
MKGTKMIKKLAWAALLFLVGFWSAIEFVVDLGKFSGAISLLFFGLGVLITYALLSYSQDETVAWIEYAQYLEKELQIKEKVCADMEEIYGGWRGGIRGEIKQDLGLAYGAMKEEKTEPFFRTVKVGVAAQSFFNKSAWADWLESQYFELLSEIAQLTDDDNDWERVEEWERVINA